ncbi:unnamed protein product [Bemisia tabaci]|uniref:Cc8L18.2-like protein n=1 Tax=Bemisia tabaci TaxID=7038 RepID=A0A9P0AHF6_BEMTA|nr:unnamed protein product [Bemisia tabaci]
MSKFMKTKMYCSNPLNKKSHSKVSNGLRDVQPWMMDIVPSLRLGDKICNNCRMDLGKLRRGVEEEFDDDSEAGTSAFEESMTSQAEAASAIESINSSLAIMGESPVSNQKIVSHKKYPQNKFNKITRVLKRKLFKLPDESDEEDQFECEIISQLKEKFSGSESRSEKLQILTILPKSWTVSKIEKTFNTTNYTARLAKKLQAEKGILATPNIKIGRILSAEIEEQIKKFFESDEISRVMPGKKDFKSLIIDGKRVHVQKRLILCNLKEAYAQFKGENPGIKVGFSKFSSLRPKNCVLPGSSGSHAVCVCAQHQNMKLMMYGGKLAELTKNFEVPLTSYKHCVAKIACNPPRIQCFFKECEECPGVEGLKKSLERAFEENEIDEISYQQWVTTDRAKLEEVTQNSADFLEAFADNLRNLLTHSFIAFQQAAFFKEKKETLENGEYAVVLDFAENYSFILQDEIQGFHWNNDQATIHPFVAYYRHEETLQHISYIIISDCLRHDAVSVHLFLVKLISFLKAQFPNNVKKIYYFSDGAASQYKNRKNYSSLCSHSEEFNVEAEWHHFATSHGKNACDGVGGTVKRLAARASLQRPYNEQIMTPRQLYDWVSTNIHAMNFQYVLNSEYEMHCELLHEKFNSCQTIAGTQKLHAFIPISNTTLQTKLFSRAEEARTVSITGENSEELTLGIDEIRGFVVCMYGSEWWLACVLQTFPVNDEVKLTFLHPSGPNVSFYYPSKPDILEVPISDVLMTVDPTTQTGRVYSLSKQESDNASLKLKRKLNL